MPLGSSIEKSYNQCPIYFAGRIVCADCRDGRLAMGRIYTAPCLRDLSIKINPLAI